LFGRPGKKSIKSHGRSKALQLRLAQCCPTAAVFSNASLVRKRPALRQASLQPPPRSSARARAPCTSLSAAGSGVLRWHPAAPPKAAWKRRALQSPEAPARRVLRPYRLPDRDPARCRTVLESLGACQLHTFTHRPSATARFARLPGARAAGPGPPRDLAALGCDPKHNPEARGRRPSYPCSRPRHASLRTTRSRPAFRAGAPGAVPRARGWSQAHAFADATGSAPRAGTHSAASRPRRPPSTAPDPQGSG